jgi:two-component system, NarL family, nitrate/nitrite response regulator NarL
MSPCIRIVLVDDHKSVLWGLQKLIESAAPRMKVVASATSCASALSAVETEQPDLVLLDLDLGNESGLDIVSQIRKLGGAKVLILTGMRDPELVQPAVVAGASGIVYKSEPAEVILRAIECVQLGQLWLDRGTTARVVAAFWNGTAHEDAPAEDLLTPGERRIIAAVTEHKSAPNKVIAHSLNISQHTLRNHLAAIYAKLGVHRRLDLVLYAMDKGLVKGHQRATREVGCSARAQSKPPTAAPATERTSSPPRRTEMA